MRISICGNYGEDNRVFFLNGAKVGKFGLHWEGEDLDEFLKRVGSEGWEVVNYFSVGESSWKQMLFKQPEL
jgi:hypothetical protein